MNFYLQIFLESVWYASVMPFSHQATFFAMRAFGGFNMELAAALATGGAVLGQLFNWFVGSLFIAAFIKRKGTPGWYEKAAYYFNRYAIFLLLFCWAGPLNTVVVIAGILSAPIRVVLPLVIIAEAGFYLYQVL